MGLVEARGARAASLRGPRAGPLPGGACPRSVLVLAHERGGRVNRRRERRWQSSQDRARVAAELIEEAESLTETGAIASPLDVARDRLPPPFPVELEPAEAPAPPPPPQPDP